MPCETLKSGEPKLSTTTISVSGGVNNKIMTLTNATIIRISGGYVIRSNQVTEGLYDLGNYFTCAPRSDFTISIS